MARRLEAIGRVARVALGVWGVVAMSTGTTAVSVSTDVVTVWTEPAGAVLAPSSTLAIRRVDGAWIVVPGPKGIPAGGGQRGGSAAR